VEGVLVEVASLQRGRTASYSQQAGLVGVDRVHCVYCCFLVHVYDPTSLRVFKDALHVLLQRRNYLRLGASDQLRTYRPSATEGGRALDEG